MNKNVKKKIKLKLARQAKATKQKKDEDKI